MYGEDDEDGNDGDKSGENDYDDVNIYNDEDKNADVSIINVEKKEQKSSILISELQQPPFEYKPLINENNTNYIIDDEATDQSKNKVDVAKPATSNEQSTKVVAVSNNVTATTADNIVVEPTTTGISSDDVEKKNNPNSKSIADMNQSNDNNNFQSEYELKFDKIIPDLNDKQEYIVRMESSITCTSF